VAVDPSSTPKARAVPRDVIAVRRRSSRDSLEIVANERLTSIRDDLVDAQVALIEVLASVGTSDWPRPSPNEGWTIRDLLVHLTTSESGFVPTLRRMAAGEGGVPADFDPDRWNAGQKRRRAEMSPDQLRSELESAHADMLTFLSGLDDAGLDHRGHMNSGTDGSTEDNFRLVASHKRIHTADIRAALAARAEAS
jgi:uncharacterized protein (TIGR03083 family)